MDLIKKIFCAILLAFTPSAFNANDVFTEQPFCGLTTDRKIGLIEHPCGIPLSSNPAMIDFDICTDTFRMRSTIEIQILNMYDKYSNYIRRYRLYPINLCLPRTASLNVTETLKTLQLYVLGFSCIGEVMNYSAPFQSTHTWLMTGRFRDPADSRNMCHVLNDVKQMMCVLSQDENVDVRFHPRLFDQIMSCRQFHRINNSRHRDRLFVKMLLYFYEYLTSLSQKYCTVFGHEVPRLFCIF